MKTTHTYALLEISPPAFNEIARKLVEAGSRHAFGQEDGKPVADMHGLAVTPNVDLKAEDVYVEVRSMLSAQTKEGMVTLRLNDAVTQMDLTKAREVLKMLWEAVEAAASDQILYQFMREKVGLEEHEAGNALNEFREIRHGSRHLVIPS